MWNEYESWNIYGLSLRLLCEKRADKLKKKINAIGLNTRRFACRLARTGVKIFGFCCCQLRLKPEATSSKAL